MTYPIKHISIRVPWRDTGWDERVCAKPRLNGACLKLKRIGQERDDAAEEAVAGKSLVCIYSVYRGRTSHFPILVAKPA